MNFLSTTRFRIGEKEEKKVVTNSPARRDKITRDSPIEEPEEDLIDRATAARKFAQSVLELDTSEGVVVGVLGPWGSGKTSFINLAKKLFKKKEILVIDFNPWMFSGTAQLVESFFIELTAQLKIRPDLVEIGEKLENYGEIFFSFGIGGQIVGGAVKSMNKYLQSRKKGVHSKRRRLEKALSGIDKPIVVVLDDIDRLSSSEIRDIFKLIRLTANFPNIIYIVAFDRDRVEDALAEQGLRGRDYLEKILQVAVDLPVLSSDKLNSQITLVLGQALADIENLSPVDEQVWPDVFMEIIRPLIRNMRDVRRYAATVHGTVSAFNGQIKLVDLLALEAIRIFLPDVFKLLHSAIDGLTGSNSITQVSHLSDEFLQKQIDSLIKAAEDHSDVVKSMVTQLFPTGGHHIGGRRYGDEWKEVWLKERCVAHEDILRLYLECFESRNQHASIVTKLAWKHIAEHNDFDEYLNSIDQLQLQKVIASLEVFEEQFEEKHVVPGDQRRGMFDLSPTSTVIRVIYRLLKSLNDPAEVKTKVDEILPKLESLSSKLALINIVGYQEGVGHRLVPKNEASKFERAWRDEVRLATANDLVDEHDLLEVLLQTKRANDPSKKDPLYIDDSPQLTLALLRTAQRKRWVQEEGNRTVQRVSYLAGDDLVELYGGEGTLEDRIDDLRDANLDGSWELIELANEYLDTLRDSGSQ